MPTGSRREHALIELFLSSYERNSWTDCNHKWLEKEEDGTVEILATRPDGKTLAIEHTLIQPFAGDKEDFARFKRFLSIEQDESLIIPGEALYINVPVGTLQKGHLWGPVVAHLHKWLKTNRQSLPEGPSEHICPIDDVKVPDLKLQVRRKVIPGFEGSFLIRRYITKESLSEVLVKALQDKLPKLVKTEADKRILLLERDQFNFSEQIISDGIENISVRFPDLAKVDEIWFAETVFYETDKYVGFELYNNGDLVQSFGFLDGRLFEKSENGVPSLIETVRL